MKKRTDMAGIIEAPQHPLVGRPDDFSNRTVPRVRHSYGVDAQRMADRGADHPAVAEDGHGLIRVVAVNGVERAHDPFGQFEIAFRLGDLTPLLVAAERLDRRMILLGHLPEPTPLGDTQIHLTQIAFDPDAVVHSTGQGLRTLLGPDQRRGVYRIEDLPRQPAGDPLSLPPTPGRQGRVTVTVDQRERLALDRWNGLAMPYEHEAG